MDTLGSMKASVVKWIREPMEDDLVREAINDAIESLWLSIVQYQMELFIGGPTTLNLASGTQRTEISAVSNPSSAPSVSNVAGGSLGARSYSITITLVTPSGSETLESPATTFSASSSNVAEIASPTAVALAYGYNVYAGSTAALRAKQNDVPIPFGTAFQEPPGGFTDYPGGIAPPSANTTNDLMWYIEKLEVLTQDGIYKPYDQTNLNSLIMARAARTIASTSDYQTYLWDLVNGYQIEIRPPTGMALSPRYFFVRRPGRLLFDDAPLPFTAIPAAQFVRQKALSDLCLSIYEFDSASAWEQKAEGQRTNILLALLQQSRNKNRTITPYNW